MKPKYRLVFESIIDAALGEDWCMKHTEMLTYNSVMVTIDGNKFVDLYFLDPWVTTKQMKAITDFIEKDENIYVKSKAIRK